MLTVQDSLQAVRLGGVYCCLVYRPAAMRLLWRTVHYTTVQYTSPSRQPSAGSESESPNIHKGFHMAWHGTACLLACTSLTHSLTNSLPADIRGEVSEATRRQRHRATRRLRRVESSARAREVGGRLAEEMDRTATHACTLQPNPKAWKRSRATRYEPKYENHT